MISNRTRGFLQVGGSAAVMGSIGVLVRSTDMPASLLLVLRMLLAGAILAAVFARAASWREVRRPGVAPKLVAIGVIAAFGLLTYVLAIRYADVAIATFLTYMAPVYVAALAPPLFRQRYDRVVFIALAVALAGMAAIVLPGGGGGVETTAFGVTMALASGAIYAVYLLVVKSLAGAVSAPTVVIAECIGTAIVLAPLAIVQVAGSGYRPSLDDAVTVTILAVVNTALTFTLFVDGLRRVRVEQGSILGYLEPVTAPLYALLLLHERPGAWTVLGGAAIVAAGVLVVAFGKAEEEVLV